MNHEPDLRATRWPSVLLAIGALALASAEWVSLGHVHVGAAASVHHFHPHVGAHRHEAGHHEAGRHEAGRHEAGRHDGAGGRIAAADRCRACAHTAEGRPGRPVPARETPEDDGDLYLASTPLFALDLPTPALVDRLVAASRRPIEQPAERRLADGRFDPAAPRGPPFV